MNFGDIVHGLPIASNSCDAIYCSHVLEHLSLVDFRIALRRTFEYLKPGGTFRFVLPDLRQIVDVYVASKGEQPTIEFMENTLLGRRNRPRGLGGMVREYFGNSRHLWMWDYSSMVVELKQVGFITIRRAAFGDAEDARFGDVEDRGRWNECLGIDCKKPTPT